VKHPNEAYISICVCVCVCVCVRAYVRTYKRTDGVCMTPCVKCEQHLCVPLQEREVCVGCVSFFVLVCVWKILCTQWCPCIMAVSAEHLSLNVNAQTTPALISNYHIIIRAHTHARIILFIVHNYYSYPLITHTHTV